jgi:hypothetical protein
MEAIDMTRKTSITAAVGAALLGLTLATQATTLRPTSAEVQDQIRIMETSITDSSVSFSSNRQVACSTRWSAATASR